MLLLDFEPVTLYLQDRCFNYYAITVFVVEKILKESNIIVRKEAFKAFSAGMYIRIV